MSFEKKYRYAVLVCFFVWLIGLAFLLAQANAAGAELSWPPNTEADLAGYNVYVGDSSRVYGLPVSVSAPTVAHSMTFDVLCGDDVTKFFAVTAVDLAGHESVFSNEVFKVFNLPPCAPTLTVTIQITINITKSGDLEVTVLNP